MKPFATTLSNALKQLNRHQPISLSRVALLHQLILSLSLFVCLNGRVSTLPVSMVHRVCVPLWLHTAMPTALYATSLLCYQSVI